jgi:hypothetical protein
VPSRPRGHHVNLWGACARKASPLSSARPPRPRLAAKARSPCAQPTCRPRPGDQVVALERSVPRMPEHGSPHRARATWPPRDLRPSNTVTRLGTAPHRQARWSPWRPLVAARWATACPWTSARAASTGAATPAVVAGSDWLSGPTRMGTPHRASLPGPVVPLDKR